MQFGQLLRNKVPKDALFMGFLEFFRGDSFRESTEVFRLMGSEIYGFVRTRETLRNGCY